MTAVSPELLSEGVNAVARERLSFAAVYRDHSAFAWRAASALGVPRSSIEDVVQEIFVVVHQRLSGFEGRSSVKTWISGIVLNVVRRHRRTVLRRNPVELDRGAPIEPDDLRSAAADPHEAAERAEGTALLQAILASLAEEKREVLVLAELEELPVPEIAEALGIPLNTAYSRLRLARQDFDKALARYHAREKGKAR